MIEYPQFDQKDELRSHVTLRVRPQANQLLAFLLMNSIARSRIAIGNTCAVVALTAAATLGGSGLTAGEAAAAQVVKGEVSCINSSVTGVWINAEKSKSGWATWKMPIVLGGISKADYSYSLNKGGRFQVHVGCGGSSKKWKVNAKSGWVSGTNNRFRCNDISPALQAAGVAVFKKNLAQGIPYKTCKKL
ncbi:MAG: hypothetical protein WBA05_08785 [Gordonia sp. (in: high G+C Gram-positive bacteria)]|uniref:hypothetical protein n=1 Tax=Gordonia sp. (in: high G+C Gram-positive bacteria) TaxID=84139 RepID=UPI003C73224F